MKTYEDTLADYERRGYVETQTGENWAVMEKGREKKPINHILHILLTILTGGIWLIVYAVLLIIDTFTPGLKRFRVSETKPGRVRVSRI